MESKISAVVTFPDLNNWFSGQYWRSSHYGNVFEASTNNLDVSFSPESIMFHTKISSEEDPLDSDEIVSEDPMGFISEFLETGSEPEMFSRNSADHFLNKFKKIASQFSLENIEISNKELRKMIASVEFKENRENFLHSLKFLVGSSPDMNELSNLEKEMRKRGWGIIHEKSPVTGRPSILVDISGIYEARIEIDSILWNYSFQVRGEESTKEKGLSNEPIAAFKKWLHNPNTKEVINSKIEKAEMADSTPTVPS